MHYLSTLVKAICLTIALGSPTAAFANVSTPSTIPPTEAPVEAPVVICPVPNMPMLDDILAEAETNNLPTIAVLENGVSTMYIWDVSSIFPDGAPYLVGIFDLNGCFLDSTVFDKQGLQDNLGIVLQ